MKVENFTLVIEDTGIGIRAEDIPRIFEKGYTGVNGRDDNRATGIGLYLQQQDYAQTGTSSLYNFYGRKRNESIS